MFEIKMIIEIPGLPEALNALAGAIGKQPEIVCHQHGGNNHHIDNAGVVNVDFTAAAPKTVELPAVNPTTPVQAVSTTSTAELTPVQPTVPTNAAPTAPAGPGESYTLEALVNAGTALVDAGKVPQLLALLSKYGVPAVTQVPKEAYSAFGAELKAIGAQL